MLASSDPFSGLPDIGHNLPRPNSIRSNNVGYGATSEEDSMWPPNNSSIVHPHGATSNQNPTYDVTNLLTVPTPSQNLNADYESDVESSSEESSQSEGDAEYFSDTYRPQRDFGSFDNVFGHIGNSGGRNLYQQQPIGQSSQSTSIRSAHSRWPETPFPQVDHLPSSSSSSSSTSSATSSSSSTATSSSSHHTEFDPFANALSSSMTVRSSPPPPVDFSQWFIGDSTSIDTSSSHNVQSFDPFSTEIIPPPPPAPASSRRPFWRNIAEAGPVNLREEEYTYSYNPVLERWLASSSSPPSLPSPSAPPAPLIDTSTSAEIPTPLNSEIEQLKRSLTSAQTQLLAERLNSSVLRDRISELSTSTSSASSHSNLQNASRNHQTTMIENKEIEWVCTTCTLHNNQDVGICGACGERKPQFTSATAVVSNQTIKTESFDCVVCMDAPRDAVFVHGMDAHHVCCNQCALTLVRSRQSCPVCQRPIEKILKYYS